MGNADCLDPQADEWLSRHPDELAGWNHEIQDRESPNPGVRRPGFKYCIRDEHGIIDRYFDSGGHSWELCEILEEMVTTKS